MNRLARTLALVVAQIALVGSAAHAQLVINEVDYDQPGTDGAEFIELYNRGLEAVNLGSFAVSLINGANGGAVTYGTPIALPGVMLAPGGFFVVCANAATVAPCDLDVSPNTDLIQNGAPDAIALFDGALLADSLSYEGNVPGFTENQGAGADTAAAAPSPAQSLSRCPSGADSQDNAADFALRTATPGAANDCPAAGPVIGQCGDPATLISAVQGSAAQSPLAGQTVVVEAVVVGDFQSDPLRGFFLQEEDVDADADPATSEGLFVLDGSSPVPVSTGDRVRARGQVNELSSLTQLGSVSDVLVCPGAPLASEQTLMLPVAAVADLERLEGMRVHIPQRLTVTGNFELGRFGSLDLSVGGRLFVPTHAAAPGAAALAVQDSNRRSRIVLDDRSTAQNPDPIPYKDANQTRRVGDSTAQLTGILDGRFGVYRIQPTVAPIFQNDNPRPPAPADVGGRLKVASLNVLNYFTTLDEGQPVCGPSGGLDCRGANTAAELERQRAKILNALVGLGADIAALNEVENSASAAVADLVSGLNDRLGAGTYAFIDTGSIGTDAIKLAFLYRPAKVSPVGAFAVLDSAVDPRFLDTKNRPSLAQTFEERSSGARLTVIANHLKSKGSACDDVGDPDRGDGQGNCNGTRTAAARALLDWIATDPTHSGDADFLLIGDLNSYEKEDPITALVAGGLDPLVQRLIGADAHSFQFQGESGYLDHALATAALSPQITGVTEWHINADEPVVLDYNLEFKTADPFRADDPFRASDHDPLLVGLDPAVPPPAVPRCAGLPATVYVAGGRIVGGPDQNRVYGGLLRGTAHDDVLVGTDAAELLAGRGGADVICGRGGSDLLLGGDGPDSLFGEDGDDELLGQQGRDLLSGGSGTDVCLGQRGDDDTDGSCEILRSAD